MAIRRICVDEVTTLSTTFSETITCTNPAFTPVGPGKVCNAVLYNVGVNLDSTPMTLSFSFDAQFEYEYEHAGSIFRDYCNSVGNSGFIALPGGTTLCPGATAPEVKSSVSCDPENITTTPTLVSGVVNMAFTITNLCTSAIICVNDSPCP